MLSEFCWWPARFLLLALVAFVPWPYGSVTWQTQLQLIPVVLAILALSLMGGLLKGSRASSFLIWSIAALILMALVQTIPLSNSTWKMLAPQSVFDHQVSEVVHQWSVDSNDASFVAPVEETSSAAKSISIHPLQSRASIAVFSLGLAVLLSSMLIFNTERWEIVLLVTLGATALANALVGLIQVVAWNDWTLLPMHNPDAPYSFSTFASRNSAPQLFAIGIGCIIGLLSWWTSSKSARTDSRYKLNYPAVNILARLRRRMDELVVELDALSICSVLAVTLIFLATLAASSRGGILACFAAGFLTFAIAFGSKGGFFRSAALVTVITGVALMLTTTLELNEGIADRLDTLSEEVYSLKNGRLDVWQMALSQSSLWLTGCGLGNFHFAILPAYTSPSPWYYHAESIYVELFSELGIFGLLIGMCGLFSLLWRLRYCTVEGRSAAPTYLATIFVVAAIGLQNLVDFSLILPGIFLPTAALIGCFLGRSSDPNFGKRLVRRRKKHTHSHSPTHTHSQLQKEDSKSDAAQLAPSQKSNVLGRLALIGVSALVFFSVYIGHWSLRGFALAERIQADLQRTKVISSRVKAEQRLTVKEVVGQLTSKELETFAGHPEVSLQVGRGLQAYFQEALSQSNVWPRDDQGKLLISQPVIESFSAPEFASTALRSTNTDRFQDLRTLLRSKPQILELLDRSESYLRTAQSACAYDWRPAWGLIRGDTGKLATAERIRNYAILKLLTRRSSSLPAEIGATAIAAGDRTIGLDFLKSYLSSAPQDVNRVAIQNANELSPDEFVKILPPSQLAQADIAESLSQNKDFKDLVAKLLSTLEPNVVLAEADENRFASAGRNRPWLVAAWVAEQKASEPQFVEIQLKALQGAARVDANDHRVIYRIAKLLQSLGRYREAHKEAERALRLAREVKEYQDLVAELQKQKVAEG